MAKLKEEILVVKISTLLPDSAEDSAVMTEDNIAALQQIIEEMIGNNRTMVEIESAQ